MKKTAEAVTNAMVVGWSNLTVTDLPDDVIFLILSYLDVPSLGRICQTCTYLRALASSDSIWLRYSKRHNIIKDRCCDSLKNKCRVAQNWAQGKFQEVTLIKNPVRLLPWLQHDDSRLFFSSKNCIKQYQVLKNGHLRENSQRHLRGPKEDVCRFVNKNNLTVCGCRDGTVMGWETSSGCQLFNYKLHSSDAQCVDIIETLVVSGSRDATVKVTSMQPDGNYSRLRKTLNVGARVWSLAVSSHGSLVASGSSGCGGVPPVTIWDLHSGEVVSQLGSDHKRGAGVLDMKFESPYTLLTCGHDTCLRLWDLRTHTCVSTWVEPFDSALYCLATDNDNAIMTGTARHGMTRRWDKRCTNSLQMFYTGLCSSPVYSLAFNSRWMYVALDLCTNMVDFTSPATNNRNR
ncbi:F-box/WD repeat-containing protein 4-like [Haliotis rufescens]|uniref:F-box/WD repeat-containing protein 4-like n=1 Tax=Haliotis rufescens TaxID=6454 RepID=UPI001EB018E6|nr:F-box/WD repeat-containing protein 4-like [Haliotis rufescens]